MVPQHAHYKTTTIQYGTKVQRVEDVGMTLYYR